MTVVSRFIKYLSIALGVLLAIVIIFIATFDANQYKQKIITKVEQQTGRSFEIKGELNFSFFPWIALRADGVSLGNAKGFSASPMASIEQLDLKVKLLSLLLMKIDIDKIRLQGLSVSLETKKNGSNNWSSLTASSETPAAKKDKIEAEDQKASAQPSKLAAFAINGIEIIDATLLWADARDNSKLEITQLNLITSAVTFDQPVDVDFKAMINDSSSALKADVNLQTRLSFNQELTLLTADQFELVVRAMAADTAEQVKTITVTTNIHVDMKTATRQIKLQDIQLTLDESRLQGWLHVLDTAQTEIQYQLELDKINFDHYLKQEVPTEPVAENKKKASAPASTQETKITLPVGFLRGLNLDGEFKIAELVVDDIAITDISFKTRAAGGQLRIDPVTMKLLEGEMTADLGLDVRRSPLYSVKLKGSGLHPGPMVNSFLQNVMDNDKVELQGAARLSADIKTKGDTLTALKKASTGSVSFDMDQAVLNGADVEYFARNIVADYVTERKLEVPTNWRGEYSPQKKTAFDRVHASAALANGVISNNDLILDSKRVKVAGKGSANIINNTMDYYTLTDLSLSRTKTFIEKVLDQPLGVRTHGTFEQPTVEVDKDRLKKTVSNVLTKKAKARTEKKVEDKKQEIKDKLGEKLKGLFR